MIHYHGCPMTPQVAAVQFFQRRHGMVSFAHPAQLPIIAEVCQSFVLDNGAFSHWRAGNGGVDTEAYADWVRQWDTHPGFDWCIVPDVIDGDERANDAMLEAWSQAGMRHGVPVFHLHEDLGRLRDLIARVGRGVIALGSSGQYASIGTDAWWERMGAIMREACDEEGRPRCKLHGLRMLAPNVFSQVPLASADSCNVALNIGLDQRWRGPYAPLTEAQRAHVIAERIELHAAASFWKEQRGAQQTDLPLWRTACEAP